MTVALPGAPVAHPFPWHYGYVMAFLDALFRDWLNSGSVVVWLT